MQLSIKGGHLSKNLLLYLKLTITFHFLKKYFDFGLKYKKMEVPTAACT